MPLESMHWRRNGSSAPAPKRLGDRGNLKGTATGRIFIDDNVISVHFFIRTAQVDPQRGGA